MVCEIDIYSGVDIMHAYFGLATLSLYRQDDLPGIDPACCISLRAKDRLRNVPWWRDVEVAHKYDVSPVATVPKTTYVDS